MPSKKEIGNRRAMWEVWPVQHLRILHVEPDENDAFFLAHIIGKVCPGCQLTRASDATSALKVLREGPLPDVIVTGEFSIINSTVRFLKQLQKQWPMVPRVTLTNMQSRVGDNELLEAGSTLVLEKGTGLFEMEEHMRLLLEFMAGVRSPS